MILEYFCIFSDCSIWTLAFIEETKIVLAKVNPTKTGRISVGSGTERFGHQNRPSADICINLSSTGQTSIRSSECLMVAMLRIPTEVKTQNGI